MRAVRRAPIPDAAHRRRETRDPPDRFACAHGRQHDAVLHHRDQRPGAQGPAGGHLRRPAVHRPGALGLLFVADYQKWMDLFAAPGSTRWTACRRGHPGVGDLLLACCDALIAAQNAAIAAESLGIGSCYIGDIMEQAETMPSCSACRGTPSPSLCSASVVRRPGRTSPSGTKSTSYTGTHTEASARTNCERSRTTSTAHTPRAASRPAPTRTSGTSTRASSPPVLGGDEPVGEVVDRAVDGDGRLVSSPVSPRSYNPSSARR